MLELPVGQQGSSFKLQLNTDKADGSGHDRCSGPHERKREGEREGTQTKQTAVDMTGAAVPMRERGREVGHI